MPTNVLPLKDAADGVEAVMGKRTPVLRFGPRAAKLYRGLAGRKASVGCGRPGIDNSAESADGDVTAWGGGSFDPSTGLHKLYGGGYAGTDMRLPRSGARVKLPFTGDPYDVCFIATPARRTDRECLDPSVMDGKTTCVRVLVALTDAGRAQVDYRACMIDLGGDGRSRGLGEGPGEAAGRGDRDPESGHRRARPAGRGPPLRGRPGSISAV